MVAAGRDHPNSASGAVWADARAKALTAAQCRSPLGRRPYDLRHAAVSPWLNFGGAAPEVARRAGYGVAVLLKTYAHCIGGQADAANHRITDALGIAVPEPGPRAPGWRRALRALRLRSVCRACQSGPGRGGGRRGR